MHLRTRAELEQSIKAARQLRAETLGGVRWIVRALAGAIHLARKIVHFLTFNGARKA